MLHAVVLAGGAGTRLWPLSRRCRPKQLLPLTGRQTMLQESVSRVGGLVKPERTWVFTNRSYEAEVRRQLPHVPPSNVFGEPVMRNTAPCIGLASLLIAARDPAACVAVLTADHYVHPPRAFRESLRTAAATARESGSVVTFGIKPSFPSTGYGYIRTGDVMQERPVRVFRGSSFVEKPSAEVAREFVESGKCLWNSGMFVFPAAAMLRLFQQHLPEAYEVLERIRPAVGSRRERRAVLTNFSRFPAISVDYGIMNKITGFAVVEASFLWDDVGSWSSLARIRGGAAGANVTVGLSELLSCSRCTVISDEKHLVAGLGLDNVVIVHTADATLVCHESLVQEVRRVVAQLEQKRLMRYL